MVLVLFYDLLYSDFGQIYYPEKIHEGVGLTEYGNFFQEKFETWARVCWLLTAHGNDYLDQKKVQANLPI